MRDSKKYDAISAQIIIDISLESKGAITTISKHVNKKHYNSSDAFKMKFEKFCTYATKHPYKA